MTNRFIDPDGREISVEGESGLRKAIQEGRLQPDCLMFQADTGKWAPAIGHPAYQRTLRTSREPKLEEAAPDHAPPPGDDMPDDRPAAPTSAPAGERSEQFKIWQMVALVGVFVIAILTTSDTMHTAERLGGIFGVFLASAIFAGLFLIWSKRTRPYLPFGVFAVALLTVIGSMESSPGTSGTSQQLDELEALVDRIEEDYSVSRAMESGEPPDARQTPAGPPPPASGRADERTMWVSIRVLEAIEQITVEFEKEHRVGYEHAQGWLEPHYFANASQYPEIPAYLNRNRAFLQDLTDNLEPRVTHRMDEIMDQANLPARQREEFERSFFNGMRENSMERSGMADLHRGLVATGEELHQVLVANEHLIQVNHNTGIAEIRDAQVEQRALGLVDDLDWYIIQIAELQDEMMGNVRGMLEEGRAVLR